MAFGSWKKSISSPRPHPSPTSAEAAERDRPLRVLFITDVDLSGPSGQNVATRELVDALAHRQGVELCVACPRSDDPSLVGLWKAIGTVVLLPTKRRQSVLWGIASQASLVWQLWRPLRRHQFDVMVTRRGPSLLLPPLLARAFNLPYVLLQRGMRGKGQRSLKERLLRFPLMVTSWLDVRYADRIYVAYEEVKQATDQKRPFTRKPAIVLPNAVDPEKFPPLPIHVARSNLVDLELTGDDIVIGFVGSFRERHGIDVLIRALNRVRSIHPDTKLLAVGDGPIRPDLVALAEQLDLGHAVIFPGLVPYTDVAAYMAACDVLAAVVHPTWPSNPIKVYEYLASARPVVTSRRSELQFIQDAGLGRVVVDNDAQSFAHALIGILDLPSAERTRIGEAARAYVQRHHTWQQFADTILEG